MTLTWTKAGDGPPRPAGRAVVDGVFFAHLASPWQRATNENTNGLLRQYWPKGTDLSTLTNDQIREVETRLNQRPRKVLGWKTPAEVFTASVRCR
jgi:IS30 family transposase